MERSSWENDKEEVLVWLENIFAGKGREGYVGTSAEDLSLIVVDPEFLDKRGIKANFYVDTEFGYGTGGINTRGMAFGNVWAVYTPTHFVPPGWSEVHQI